MEKWNLFWGLINFGVGIVLANSSLVLERKGVGVFGLFILIIGALGITSTLNKSRTKKEHKK